jgi:hypothetical protein
LEAFRNFIDIYPILSDNKKFALKKRNLVDGRGIISGVLISDALGKMNAEYQLVKEKNQWKVTNLRLRESEEKNETDSEDKQVINKIEAQLEAIRSEDLEAAYYKFSSKEFQQKTSLEAFRDFVRSNPILTKYKKGKYKNSQIGENQRFADLILDSDEGPYILKYKLVREGGGWKIWGLRITPPSEAADQKAMISPEALVRPVHEFLNALRRGDFRGAYNSTAPEFQEAVSYDAFEGFAAEYPILIWYDSADIIGGSVENISGTARANLHFAKEEMTIEFQLGFDDGKWKIWGMKVVEQRNVPHGERSAPAEL